MSGWISTKLADVGHGLHTIERGAAGGNCRYPAISILPPDSTRATLPSLAPTSTPRPADVNNPTGTGQSRTSPDQIYCSLLRQTTVKRLQYPRITRPVSFFSDRTLLPRSILSPPAAATAQGSRRDRRNVITLHGLSCPERWTAHGDAGLGCNQRRTGPSTCAAAPRQVTQT